MYHDVGKLAQCLLVSQVLWFEEAGSTKKCRQSATGKRDLGTCSLPLDSYYHFKTSRPTELFETRRAGHAQSAQ